MYINVVDARNYCGGGEAAGGGNVAVAAARAAGGGGGNVAAAAGGGGDTIEFSAQGGGAGRTARARRRATPPRGQPKATPLCPRAPEFPKKGARGWAGTAVVRRRRGGAVGTLVAASNGWKDWGALLCLSDWVYAGTPPEAPRAAARARLRKMGRASVPAAIVWAAVNPNM